MKLNLVRLSALTLLSVALFTLTVFPKANAESQKLPYLCRPSSQAVGEHVILVVTADAVDVTDTLFIQDGQVYAVLNGANIPLVLDYTNGKVWSPNGTQIGFITVN